jgi:hypothetical protein
MRLLDIRSWHAVFLEKPNGQKFCIFLEKPRWRKWGSNLGLHARAVWHGAGERALRPQSDRVIGSW